MWKKKQNVLFLCVMFLIVQLFTGCKADNTVNVKQTTQDIISTDVEAVAEDTELKDGEYSANVTLEGGSGRASVESPAKKKKKNGNTYATIVWSSKNYDYMVVDAEKFLNENDDGNATFTIPVTGFNIKIPVIGDTIAMSTPHEIEYTLYFEMVE